jgi:CRISPR/Cas system-associated exonuclease Cas4 (RecB family)
MRIIRASEIGTYLFCKRAWWYQLNGYESENQVELAAGKEIHEKHSRSVRRGRGLKAIASILLLAALSLVVLWYLQVRL